MREFEREEIEQKLEEIKKKFEDLWVDKFNYLPLPWMVHQPGDSMLPPGETFIVSANGRAAFRKEWIGHDGLVAMAAAPTDMRELVEMTEFLFSQVYKRENKECKDG